MVAEIDKRIEARFRDRHTIEVITSMLDRAPSWVPRLWLRLAET
ncbi:hypothetical protein [Streptomyces sp. NPDC005476]